MFIETDEYWAIRIAIIRRKESFCLEQLYDYLEEMGHTNRNLILSVLEELDNEGLVTYECHHNKDPFWEKYFNGYCFKVIPG